MAGGGSERFEPPAGMSAQPPTRDEVAAGHAFYTRRTLAIYDLAILGYFSRLAWRCPSRRVEEHFDRHVTGNHLDVGVGTGFFLDRCSYPTGEPRIALLDASKACLEAAGRRIRRYQPEIFEASILEPVEIGCAPFDSISMNYLLHCLPGDLESKQVVFEHLRPLASPHATVFGATLLAGGVQRNWFARQVMERNNRVGIFSNRGDDLAGLKRIVHAALDDGTVEVVGCVGLFAGTLRAAKAPGR